MRRDFGALPAPEPRPTLASILDGRRPLRPASRAGAAPAAPAAVRAARAPAASGSRPRSPTGAVLFSGLASGRRAPGPDPTRDARTLGARRHRPAAAATCPASTTRPRPAAPGTARSDAAGPGPRSSGDSGPGPVAATPPTTVTAAAGRRTTPARCPFRPPARRCRSRTAEHVAAVPVVLGRARRSRAAVAAAPAAACRSPTGRVSAASFPSVAPRPESVGSRPAARTPRRSRLRGVGHGR